MAETRDEAMRLLLPNLQMMAPAAHRSAAAGRSTSSRTPKPQTGQPQEQAVVDCGSASRRRRRPAEAADQVRALAAHFDVDEVMVNPVASAYRGTDPRDRARPRHTLELLAKELF